MRSRRTTQWLFFGYVWVAVFWLFFSYCMLIHLCFYCMLMHLVLLGVSLTVSLGVLGAWRVVSRVAGGGAGACRGGAGRRHSSWWPPTPSTLQHIFFPAQ